jgi:hypothetical protein
MPLAMSNDGGHANSILQTLSPKKIIESQQEPKQQMLDTSSQSSSSTRTKFRNQEGFDTMLASGCELDNQLRCRSWQKRIREKFSVSWLEKTQFLEWLDTVKIYYGLARLIILIYVSRFCIKLMSSWISSKKMTDCVDASLQNMIANCVMFSVSDVQCLWCSVSPHDVFEVEYLHFLGCNGMFMIYLFMLQSLFVCGVFMIYLYCHILFRLQSLFVCV